MWKKAGREMVAAFGGDSMRPTISAGTQVLLRCGEGYAVGDILAFVQGGRVVVHRLVARAPGFELTRGDAHALPDPPIVESQAVFGRVHKVRHADSWSDPGAAPDSLLRRSLLALCVFALRRGPAPGRTLISALHLLRRWIILAPRTLAARLVRRPALVLLAASSGLALLLAEGVVRVVAPQGLRVAWLDEVGGARAPLPGIRGRHFAPGLFDVTVTINRQRLRARREYATVPSPEVTRVAALGDSFTFGWGVEDEEAWPAQLQQLLGSARFEVLNAGFPATSFGEKVLSYERVRSLAPRVVLLMVVADDVDGEFAWKAFALDAGGGAVLLPPTPGRVAGRRLTRLPGFGWLSEHSQLLGLLRGGLSAALAPGGGVSLANHPSNPAYEASVRARFPTTTAPLLGAELRRLSARVRESGARLDVILAPGAEDVYPIPGAFADALRWRSRSLVEILAPECARQGLSFLDMTEPMRRLAEAEGNGLYYQGTDTHPTPRGHRAFAEAIAAFLGESGLLSSP